jgi:hypothetical protein
LYLLKQFPHAESVAGNTENVSFLVQVTSTISFRESGTEPAAHYAQALGKAPKGVGS